MCIRDSQRLGTTIIYVTHDQTEAMTLGTRIVVMKDGVVQQVDSPQNLYDKPANKFVAGFIGAPQMNLIDAAVAKSGNDITLSSVSYTHLDVYKRQLLEVGLGFRTPESVREILETGNREKAGKTMPPEGLALVLSLIHI